MNKTLKLIDFLRDNEIRGDVAQFKGYSSNKNEFKKLSRAYFKEFAKANNYEGDFRFCSGGPAVSGEAIFHSENFYIQIHPDKILYRSCKSRKDFCGGMNNWMEVKDLEKLGDKIKLLLITLP